MHQILTIALLLSSLPTVFVGASEFNFEISFRVEEKLAQYMKDPISIARIIAEFRANHGFPHDMAAPDRNIYMKLNDALMTQVSCLLLITFLIGLLNFGKSISSQSQSHSHHFHAVSPL